jgi:hypothetical protein
MTLMHRVPCDEVLQLVRNLELFTGGMTDGSRNDRRNIQADELAERVGGVPLET